MHVYNSHFFVKSDYLINLVFSLPDDKIQISKTTWLLLSMKGGFVTEERGLIEVKVLEFEKMVINFKRKNRYVSLIIYKYLLLSFLGKRRDANVLVDRCRQKN